MLKSTSQLWVNLRFFSAHFRYLYHIIFLSQPFRSSAKVLSYHRHISISNFCLIIPNFTPLFPVPPCISFTIHYAPHGFVTQNLFRRCYISMVRRRSLRVHLRLFLHNLKDNGTREYRVNRNINTTVLFKNALAIVRMRAKLITQNNASTTQGLNRRKVTDNKTETKVYNKVQSG